MNTSPARRKRDVLSVVEGGASCSHSSSVCRTTPATSHITEGSSVTVDGQPGVVRWIGYELSKPGRYFAGVQMVSLVFFI